MIRLLALAGLLGTVGLAMVLSRAPWFRQPDLASRLRPHTPGVIERRPRVLGARSFSDALGPAAQYLGDIAARVVGITEDLGRRLDRLHRTITPMQFRIDQLRHAVLSLLGMSVLTTVLRLPPSFVVVVLLVTPVLSLLIDEQRLSSASSRWKRDLAIELPIIEEQLAMLLDAGWSLGGALGRASERSAGPVAQDLTRVLRSVRRGNSYRDALVEWKTIADVPAVDRLTSILVLADQGADLGRLVADEAQFGREERHRELLAAVERKGQQVWIPVTVAALVPGCMLLALPFIRALNFFGS
jgi:tight adherence protein C